MWRLKPSRQWSRQKPAFDSLVFPPMFGLLYRLSGHVGARCAADTARYGMNTVGHGSACLCDLEGRELGLMPSYTSSNRVVTYQLYVHSRPCSFGLRLQRWNARLYFQTQAPGR